MVSNYVDKTIVDFYSHLSAAARATSGTGTESNPYTSGAVKQAIDDAHANIGEGTKPILIDGCFDENPLILEAGTTPAQRQYTLYSENWASRIRQPDGLTDANTIEIRSDDNFLSRLWIDGFHNSGAQCIHIDGKTYPDARELYVIDCALENADRGLYADGSDEIKARGIHTQGMNGDYSIELIDVTHVQLTDLEVESEGLRISDGKRVAVSNVIVNGTSNKSGFFIDNIDGAPEQYAASNIAVNGAADRGINIQVSKSTISGIATSCAKEGVIFANCSGAAFYGEAGGNNTSAGGFSDLKFYSSATECVAYGHYASVANEGVRCICNGYAVNAGDPSAGNGDWAGHSDTAYELGATVINTSSEGRCTSPCRRQRRTTGSVTPAPPSNLFLGGGRNSVL